MVLIEGTNEWKQLQAKLAPVRDNVRAVAEHRTTGYYLYGRPGTGKSHTVRVTLDGAGVKYYWHQGYCTAKALFEILMEHLDEVVVLDDVSSLFKDVRAVEILLAALGRQHQREYRIVSWSKSGTHLKVAFLGGLIAISNLRLAKDPVSMALRSRVSANNYDVSDADVLLTIKLISHNGVSVLTPEESVEVADFVIAESVAQGVPFDLRTYCDKAVNYFLQWKSGESESHWQDLIRSQLAVKLIQPEQDVQIGPTQAEQRREEARIATEIRRQTGDGKEQVRLWKERTSKSRAAYYRIVKLLAETAGAGDKDDGEGMAGLPVG